MDIGFPKVEISVDVQGFGEVKVDGVVIPGVKRFAVESEPGTPTVVGLEIIVESLTLQAQAVLQPHIKRLIEQKVLGR